MDKYGYIGIETLLNFCENSKDHSVTPNDFMRMKRVRKLMVDAPIIEKRDKGHWILSDYQVKEDTDNGNYRYYCSNCSHADIHARTVDVPYCWYCGAKMEGGD